jgi:AcrR family transcriptional regulator
VTSRASRRSEAGRRLRPSPPPRSQAARRATTRARLLDATLECLARLGHAHTTTTEVCRRAGVSQGALFKHFETKAALVAAAAEHLFASLVADYRAAFAKVADDPDRAAAATRVLWSIFRQERLHAAFELYVAARTDAELARRLRPVAERHAESLRQQARDLFPEAAQANPDFEAVVAVAVSAMQGAALGGAALRDDARDARLLAFLERLARAVLAPSAPRD